MKEWILSAAGYFLSQWRTLLLGGVAVMSVVIFVVGVLKKLLINKIHNSLARKVILAWLSVILCLPSTFVYMVFNSMELTYFWVIYVVNTLATIFVYWFYENTAIRDLLALTGNKIVVKFLASNDLKETVKESNKEAKAVLKEISAKDGYKDDDLKKL